MSLIEQLGGAKRIHDELLEYQRRVEEMESRRPQLMEKYPDKWIAMAEGDRVVVGDSLEDCLAELDNRGLRRSNAVVKYLDTDPPMWIL